MNNVRSMKFGDLKRGEKNSILRGNLGSRRVLGVLVSNQTLSDFKLPMSRQLYDKDIEGYELTSEENLK